MNPLHLGAEGGGGGGAPAAHPLGAAPTTPVSGEGVVWQSHFDGTDVWFTSSAGDAAWELPPGAALAPGDQGGGGGRS